MAARRRIKFSLEEWEQVQKLTLMDNDFMNVALEDNIPCVQEMLRGILGRDDLIVKKVRTQHFLKGFARSVSLDVYAVDGEGTIYNIEIQREDEGADPRRPRFHGAMMDTHALKAGLDFKELPERYVIFITRNDVLGQIAGLTRSRRESGVRQVGCVGTKRGALREGSGRGRTAYVIHKYIEAGDELLPFDDGTHLIYVNGSAKDDGTELWKLIHDLKCPDASKMYFPNLAGRVKFLKDKEEGEQKMSSYFEEQRKKAAEAAAEAATEAATKKAERTFAMKLIQRGKDTLDEIAECTGLTLRQVKALAKAAAV